MQTTYFNLLLPLILSCILSTALPAMSETFSGQVISVHDGDTIEVMHNGRAEKIRLSGIDAPEKSQAFGNQAKEFAANLCFHKEVTVTTHGHDRYRRTIADITLADQTILDNALVEAGFAWWYRKYAPNNTTLEQLETSARANHRGLWSSPNQIAPWDYRH